MVFAERDGELSALRAAYDRSTVGDGRIEIVEGAVGSGKSAVLDEFAEQQKGSGALFLHATCARTESGYNFAVVRQLIDGCRAVDKSLDRLIKRLDNGTLAGMLSSHIPKTGPRVELRVQHDMHTLLTELSRQQPVVIMVDDAHHMDTSSAHCLLYAIRRLRTSPVVVVLTTSNVPPHVDALFHAELLRQPNSHTVRLAPLTEHGVRRVLSIEFDTETAAQFAPVCHSISGGSPLLLRAIVEDTLRAAGDQDRIDSITVGDGFGHAVVSCLRRSPAAAMQVACGIAVLGDAAPVVLSQLLGVEAGTLTKMVNALTAAGLLLDGRFRHPYAQTAVLGELPPRERAELHRRAAHLLRNHGASPRTLAHHLIASGSTRTPWAVDVLHQAAEQAAAERDVNFALECLKLATVANGEPAQAATTRAMMMDIEWRADPSAAASHLPDLTEAAHAGHLGPQGVLTLVRYLLWHGRNRDAVEILGVLNSPDAAVAGVQPVEARIASAWLRHTHPALAACLDAYADPSTDDRNDQVALWPDVDLRLQADRALSAVLANQADEQTVGRAKQVLQTFRPDGRTIDSIESALLTLIYSERLAEAALSCDNVLTNPALRQAPVWQARIGAVRAEIHLRQGELNEAERGAEEALDRLSPAAWGVGIGAPLATLITVRVAMGKLDEAAELVDTPVPDALLQSRQSVPYRYARGLYYLATARPRAALDEFLSCADWMSEWDQDMPTMVPWRGGAAEAWLQLGEDKRANRVLSDQLAMLDARYPRARGCTLRLLAKTVELRKRQDLLTEAIELQRISGEQFELARALYDIGAVYGELGESRRARMQTQLARHLARQCGAAALLPSGDNTGAGAANPDRTAKLTNAERRIAILAASGNTNREIAKQLFVTSSTVEQHLTRVFRKLNLKHREELPVGLGLQVLDNA